MQIDPKILILVISVLFSTAIASAQNAHETRHDERGTYGRYMTRTVSLLAESNLHRQNDVRICIYGGTLSTQSWWTILGEKLKIRYPRAKIRIDNRSVRDFDTGLLAKTIDFDILPSYPDLVIFNAPGTVESYRKIIETIRSRTSAEMLLWSDPFSRDKAQDSADLQPVAMLCEEYRVEFADLGSAWSYYADEQGMKKKALTDGNETLTEAGNRFVADLLAEHFYYDPSRDPDPWHLVDTIVPGENLPAGPLVLRFKGNRADLSLFPAGEDTARARIMIDGHPPSAARSIYFTTRPNADSTKEWPWETGTLIHTGYLSPPIPEKWTARIVDVLNGGQFRFNLTGSLTGFDGSGLSTDTFVSNSGKVIIEPSDWFVKEADASFVHSGFTITWEVKAVYADYIDNASLADHTLIKFAENRSHILEILPFSDKPLPVDRIVIYKPFLSTE